MKRDMNRIADEALKKMPDNYSLAADEWIQLVEEAKESTPGAIGNAIEKAFNYGFGLALRYVKNSK